MRVIKKLVAATTYAIECKQSHRHEHHSRSPRNELNRPVRAKGTLTNDYCRQLVQVVHEHTSFIKYNVVKHNVCQRGKQHGIPEHSMQSHHRIIRRTK